MGWARPPRSRRGCRRPDVAGVIESHHREALRHYQGANAAWYRLMSLTYNVLTVLRRWALPERFRHARPRRLRYEKREIQGEVQ